MLRLALIATLWVTACTGDESVTGYGTPGTLWVLQEIDGQPFAARATLSFQEDGQVRGRAPCNSFGAAQAAPYPGFTLTAMRITRSICAEIEDERAFLAALGAMDRADVAGDQMRLTSGAGREMVFRAEPQP